ncbi:MAG: DUF3464 family protein [Symploca sp. SIO3E6]|nr:DUF3464 family protein [Caldora sp. SIO3E6]
MSTEPSRSPLPFEPRQKSKKNAKKQPDSQSSKAASPQNGSAQAVGESTQKSKKNNKTQPQQPQSGKTKREKKTSDSGSQKSMAIPDIVSKRMVRRMAVLCGIPSVFGMATFVVSYFLVAKLGLEFPHVVVLLVSLGFFGLGVLGLSYGLFSASWDEETPGSILGWQEFTTNLGRTTSAWRSAKQKD